MKKQDGFSLLEIIIAISILASICLFAVNILSIQIDLRKKVTDQNREEHSLDMAMNRIYNDIQSAYISNPANAQSLDLVSRQVPPQFYFRNNNFVLSIQDFRSLIGNSNQSNLAMIRYYVKPDPLDKNKNQLIRVVDTDFVDNIENQDVGTAEVLVPDLKEFTLQFWSGNDYRKEWDSTANDTNNLLPKLVKIHLSFYLPEDSAEKQMREVAHQNLSGDKRKAISLDSIVYIMSTNGQNEVSIFSGDYKWQ